MSDKKDRRAINRIEIPEARALYKKEDTVSLFKKYSRPLSLVNITKSGACIEVENGFRNGDRVSISVIIPGEKTFQVKGRVKWTSQPAHNSRSNIGIQFLPFGSAKNLNPLVCLERLRQIHNTFSLTTR